MTQTPKNLVTIESHILALQDLHPAASGEFTGLLNDITFASKVVSREVRKAGLVDILGSTGAVRLVERARRRRLVDRRRLPDRPAPRGLVRRRRGRQDDHRRR